MPSSSSGSPEQGARHARTIDLIGEEGLARLRDAFVVVVGLGGVGSHAAAALLRAGVGQLRLVDFDQLTWSSLNRNLFATPADVGQPKAVVLARMLRAIDPEAQLEPVEAFFHREDAAALLAGQPDYVVDAIDSVAPKTALLQCCHERALPVVSCMGASGRTDPTQLRLGDIRETRSCPLARVIRKNLRRSGIASGITAVWSEEPARAPLPPDLDEETLRRGRVRNRLPSLGIMPGIMGYAAASVVVERLAGLTGQRLTSARQTQVA